MEYKKFKDADKIINRSDYMVAKPEENKNKWSQVFGNNNPIHLELGMGRGDFIINMAASNPRVNFIGLEISEDQLVKAVQKLNNKQLPNLKLICADARSIDTFFGREINTIYLTFSEPWPKAHDEKKRFTHESYLRLYDKIFRKDKHIIMTDWEKKCVQDRKPIYYVDASFKG